MYTDPDMMNYIHQLHAFLQAQTRQIAEMNKTMKQMEQDINQLKGNSNPPVIHNEYKFDLLKIERLEGTLNIGLNPKGAEKGGKSSIEELSVDQSVDVPSPTGQEPNLFERIRQQIQGYMNTEAREVLRYMEDRYACPLDDAYRQFILDDVARQLDQRIHYYLNQNKPLPTEPDQLARLEEQTVQCIKEDIRNTLKAFVKNLPKKSEA
ncbi:spore germination protein GerPC [Brevibacillus massiliensis]|jgi:spore germination protein PC|uniref:spore germination protein GerPC n=1 Tax=Brevibacillus massiliensis TaxID=1118054 RepID=UPI00031240F9|nr:spore germination protein GerPC [Brevibacillus massiliensis]